MRDKRRSVTLPPRHSKLSLPDTKEFELIHYEKGTTNHASHARSVERMMNPSVFFENVREHKKQKMCSPINSPAQSKCPMHFHQVLSLLFISFRDYLLIFIVFSGTFETFHYYHIRTSLVVIIWNDQHLFFCECI